MVLFRTPVRAGTLLAAAAAVTLWVATAAVAPGVAGAAPGPQAHAAVSRPPPTIRSRYRACPAPYKLMYSGARIGCWRRGHPLRKPACRAGYHHPSGHFSCERRLPATPPPVTTPAPVKPPATPAPTPVTPAPKPAPAPAPAAPAPAPAPSPSVDAVAARNKQMLQAAMDWGIKVRAPQLIDGTAGMSGGQFYYGLILASECVVVNPGVGRCTLYMWWEQHDYASDFTYTTTREIQRTWIFAQDLGTAVGFQMSSEPQGVLSYDFNRPWYMICSNFLHPPSGSLPVCSPSRWDPYPTLPAH